MSCPMWVLGTKLGSSVGAVCALNTDTIIKYSTHAIFGTGHFVILQPGDKLKTKYKNDSKGGLEAEKVPMPQVST